MKIIFVLEFKYIAQNVSIFRRDESLIMSYFSDEKELNEDLGLKIDTLLKINY